MIYINAILICAFGIIALMYFVIRKSGYYPRMQVEDTPRTHGLPFETVDFHASDGVKLKGWFISNSSDAPTIVLCHGVGKCKADLLPFASFLYKKGFNSFLFDFRSHGESEGNRTAFGCHERRDLEAAIKFVSETGKSNNHKIGLFGTSMGASIAIMVARDASEVGGVVADSPFHDLSKTLSYHLWKGYHIPPIPFFYVGQMIFNLINRTRMQDFSPMRAASKLTPRGLLLIHGDEDSKVPPHCAEAIFERASRPKELWLVSEVGHREAYEASKQEYEDKVAGFFHRYLLK